MDLNEIKYLQLDALKEISNIGTGHAATALSQMTGHRISLKVPRATILKLKELPEFLENLEEVIAIEMNILGDFTGKILILFAPNSAYKIADILLQRETEPPYNFDEIDELTRSAIAETGNILAGAYLNALNRLLQLLLLISIPIVHYSTIHNIVESTYSLEQIQGRIVICLETAFSFSKASEEEIDGWFLLIPDSSGLEVILKALELY